MVTKGIITSIDFNGNTCQVRIPLFETAGNDPITGTAIVSNTPGSYNGYKVGDVVLVAFEDGKMQNPVIVGKLYLGAAKEKQDPRGTINVETTTASKSASLPADAVLTANVDSNVPNTNTPFGSLAGIANNLNSLNTDVNQLDRFTRNQFNSVITDVNDQGEQLRSEIKQTASNIEANVVHKHQDGSQNALGWDLDEKEWKINAQDTVNGVVKDINIVTIDRNGMSIAGDLKLNGYPRNITALYAQTGSDKDYPKLYNFTEVKFPVPFPSVGEDKDKTWYYGKYIKITKGSEEKYVLVFKENFEHYDIKVGTTVAYNRNINPSWSTETPKRVDGQYIWQWTHTEIYSFDGDKWDEQDDDKITCITGATGSTGEPATIYWAKLSTTVHTGKNQKSDIEITPYAKTGNSQEVVDTTAYFNYSLDNGANWKNDDWTPVTALQNNKIVILANDIRADNIIIKLAHAYTDSNDSTKLIYNEYETETITYSPLNTPIIDLTNDTDVIKYKPDGHKITADVSSTAQVYLGGSPEAASYRWSCYPKNSADFTVTEEEPQKITVNSISSDKAILTCTATTTNFKDENGKAVQISKDFVVSREVVVASYWLSFSPVHTGNLQQTDIEVKALAKIGNDSESKDTNAYFRYSWDNGTNWTPKDWTKPTDATLIIPKADIQNNNLRIQATHDSNGDDRQVYEDETITYSPLNTPVLDLTNDSASLPYNGDTKIGSDVAKSTGKLWLNGKEFSGTYKLTWEAIDESCSIIQDGNTVSVNALNVTTAIARCTVTEIEGYKETTLTKDFIISKSLKGADGKPGDSIYTISIDNDFDSVPADVNGNVSSSYSWESETKHNVRVYYGKEAQDFTVIDQSGTAPSTGLCLKYKLTNVTLENITPDPGVSSKVATAWINSLSADAGNILYTLYVDGVETGIAGKFSVTKIKSPAPTYTISIDNDFATIPTSTVNAKIYRKTGLKFKPADNGYIRETIHVAGGNKVLPGMRLSAVNNTINLNDALLWKPDEVIKITSDKTKSYVEDITKHNVTVYCNDAVETITADNFIVKLDSYGLDADMDKTQNYLVCELGGFDHTGTRATDFPGMNPTVKDNVVTNYITALSALGDSSESKNVYIQYTYYAKGKPVATAKFEVTRHTGPTTYYLSSNVSTIKVNKDTTITPNKVICTAYSLDTSTNTNTKFTNGIWRYKWDNGALSPDKSTASYLEISTTDVIKNSYKQLYIELYLDNQLWDRETIDVIADGENAVDYRIIASSGTIKVTKTGNKDPQFITVDFKQINGSATPAAFSGNYKVFIDNGTEPISQGTASSIILATSRAADQQIDVSSAKSNVIIELYTADGNTKLESETIDVVADGTDGQPGVYIKEVKQWYILKTSGFPGSGQKPEDIKPADNAEPTYDPAPTPTTVDKWMSTPPEAVNDHVVWTCYGSIFSDDTSSKRHIEYSIPVKDNAYALAQGKTTSYYSDTDPADVYSVKKGDCWFDTGYVNVGAFGTKAEYLGKFVISTDDTIPGNIPVNPDEPNADRYIPAKSSSTKLIKITPENINNNKINIEVGTTAAYETGNLKQWDGGKWEDIAGELVTNKLTANYINALDITTKKITVRQDNADDKSAILFEADGISNNGTVKVGGFNVTNNSICSTKEYDSNKEGEETYDRPVVYIGVSNTDKAYKVGTLSTKNWRLLIGNNFGVTDDGKLVVQEGTFSGSLAASGGSITNMSTIQGDSVECSKLSLTNNCAISTTALADDSATTRANVEFTFNKKKRTEGGDWSSGYIGGDSYYSLTIHANRQLAKPTNIGTLVSVTLEVPGESSGGSGAGTAVRKIYFNKSIIFPANVLQTSVGITGATFGSPGTIHKIKELTFDKDTHFSVSDDDEAIYKQTISCLTPLEKYTYSSEFSSSIVPKKDIALNLGASSRRWNEVYAADMYATYFYGTSDRRLKKNIKDYKPKNSILDLPVVEFDFKDSGKHQIGCIAQDLQKLFPELVETRDDGYLTIEENKLVYLLLLEIKKLNQRINILETNLSNMTSNKELK